MFGNKNYLHDTQFFFVLQLTIGLFSADVRELETPKYKCEAHNRESGGGALSEVPGRAPGQGGLCPSEAKTLLAFGRSLKVTNLLTLKNMKAKKSDTVCVVF